MQIEQQWQQMLIDAISDPQWQDGSSFAPHPLAVYRNNYRVGLMELLASIYRITRELLGEDFFTALSREYVKQQPSHSGNVHLYGAQMGDFLARFEPVAHLPYLPDVGRMEWLLHRLYYTADHQPLDVTTLATLDGDGWDNLRLPLQNALALIESPWALAQIHAFHQPDAEQAPFTLASDTRLLLWRLHGDIQLKTLDTAAFAFLQALQQGETLAAATEATLAIQPDFDLQTLLLAGINQGWFAQPEGLTK